DLNWHWCVIVRITTRCWTGFITGLILIGRKWFGRAIWEPKRTKSCCAITVTGAFGCWRRMRYLPSSRRIRGAETNGLWPLQKKGPGIPANDACFYACAGEPIIAPEEILAT